ncbi:hypothetical protein [Mycoplasma sp. ATU-Cv-508]|uniref:hypothetical protein n=1 Tax=Mycoplasma sp. ATU-Cv-508 TaxID=2048001 RepID=UPI000FDDA2D3
MVDQQVIADRTIVISGFPSFEDYFFEHVIKWRKQIPAQIATDSQGLIGSLIKYTGIDSVLRDLTFDSTKAKSFMEITGLAKKFPTFTFDDEYTLEIKATLYTNAHVEESWFFLDSYPTEGEFVFVIGLKGREYDDFNQKSTQMIFTDTREVLSERWPDLIQRRASLELLNNELIHRNTLRLTCK